MRTSSPRSTSCCPASDVKFVGRTPALGCGPFIDPVRSTRWGEQANRDVWGSRCPATAGEPARVGPAWGYGTVGSLLVRGVRTVSSCGRPGRDPG